MKSVSNGLDGTVADAAVSPALVSAVDLTKRFYSKSGSMTALQDINFEMRSGEFVSVLGPSGCGKSTLLNILAGLTSKTSGSITLDGRPIKGPQTQMGIVFQDSLLLDWRDALGNVLLQVEAKRQSPKAQRSRALELLDQVGLAGFEHKRPWELSGGMRQRVAICRALIHDPPMILMDEPFGPLDALTREQMMLDLHLLWLESRKTVLFITHSISEAVFLSDRIIVMTPRPGRIHEIVDVDLPRSRDLSVMGTPAFSKHTADIHGMFQEMGLFETR